MAQTFVGEAILASEITPRQDRAYRVDWSATVSVAESVKKWQARTLALQSSLPKSEFVFSRVQKPIDHRAKVVRVVLQIVDPTVKAGHVRRAPQVTVVL